MVGLLRGSSFNLPMVKHQIFARVIISGNQRAHKVNACVRLHVLETTQGRCRQVLTAGRVRLAVDRSLL